MRSLYIVRFGDYRVLEVKEEPDPTPGDGEVVVRVSRAGLNFADVMGRVGLYPDAPKPPMVLGYEVSGTVDAVGNGVQGLARGDRVLAVTHFKGQATHVAVPADHVFPLPPALDLDAAASLPVNYLTAFHVLHRVANVQPGFRVLIHAAAGGVGLAAVQLCRAVGEVELFGTASAAKHGALREAGVQHPIDYRTQDYAEEVRRLTAGRGVQLILDPLGAKSWRKGYGLLAPAGHLVMYGSSEMVSGPKRSLARVLSSMASMKKRSPLELMNDNRTLSGVNMLNLFGEREMMVAELSALFALHAEKKIAPRVDRVFPLAEGGEAHRYLQERRNIGKVLLDCS